MMKKINEDIRKEEEEERKNQEAEAPEKNKASEKDEEFLHGKARQREDFLNRRNAGQEKMAADSDS